MTMMTNDQVASGNNEQGMRNAGSGGRFHADRQQIDIGDYNLFQGSIQIGELFVEEDPMYPGDSNYRIEHWALFSSYAPPATNPTAPRTAIEFQYVGGRWSTAEEFRTHLRVLLRTVQLRYIKASCAEMAP